MTQPMTEAGRQATEALLTLSDAYVGASVGTLRRMARAIDAIDIAAIEGAARIGYAPMHDAQLALESAGRRDALEAAWAEADSALETGWQLTGIEHLGFPDSEGNRWRVVAWHFDGSGERMGYGFTLADALRALAAKFRETT